ncbi:MAG: restriction endonuclease [Nodosilinea sp.]
MWVELDIDSFNLYWRRGIPSYLYFLFDEKKLYHTEEDDDTYEEEFQSNNKIVRIGLKASAEESLRVLDEHGYTLEFFSEIYASFHPKIRTVYLEIVKNEIFEQYYAKNEEELDQEELEKAASEHLRKFPNIYRSDELKDFSKFIGKFIEFERRGKPPLGTAFKPFQLKDKKNYQIDFENYVRFKESRSFEFDAILNYALSEKLNFPTWISEVALLFEEENEKICPEIIDLLYLRLILGAVDPQKDMKLELQEYVNKGQCINPSDFLDELSNTIIRKVGLYNKAFQPLLLKEGNLRSRYIKSECRRFLKDFDSLDTYKKGLWLENMMSLLFGDNSSIEVVNKRVSTGDEEIDLVIKNSIESPFWQAFGSPLFFVECKNWSKPVGSKDIRDFEIKLQNHSLAKIGFFVSFNGFTSEARSEFKRFGRENYHIVPLSRVDIEEFLKTEKHFYAWLENLIAKNIY